MWEGLAPDSARQNNKKPRACHQSTGFFNARKRSTLQQNPQHATQRFSRAPQQLVADGERTEELATHVQLAQTAHRYIQGAGDLGRASLFSLMVNAWLWQRMAPMRTQMPSTGIGFLKRPRILLVSAWAFHSSRL